MNKVCLFTNKPSLYKLNYRCGLTNIWIKRDDTIDFAFGGNKVRLFEYIAHIIKSKKPDKVVTYGSAFSNFIRVAAAVCAYLKVDCDLIILDDECQKDVRGGGNEVLLNFYNAKIVHCSLQEAHDFIDEYQKKLEENGVNYFWIPGGGHIPEASFGYVDAALEIVEQLRDMNCKIDAVFLPCGTGTTQAGLVFGLVNTGINIIGITVARSIQRCKNEVIDTLRAMEKMCPHQFEVEYKFDVISGEDICYGEYNELIQDIICQLAITDGIFLDPIYNAKAFLGMKKYINIHSELENVLYLNTGGSPNIFMTRK